VVHGGRGERRGADQAQHRRAPAGVVRDAERVPRLPLPRPLPGVYGLAVKTKRAQLAKVLGRILAQVDAAFQ
jgi:hypothetical protein